LCTLHANNANQALDRIIHFFPADRHDQLWMDLSLNLRAIIGQMLVPTPDGNGRRACLEVLLNTPLAADLVRKGAVHELKDLMKRSNEVGMQTFDQALYELYDAGEITYEDALSHAKTATVCDIRRGWRFARSTNFVKQCRPRVRQRAKSQKRHRGLTHRPVLWLRECSVARQQSAQAA